MKRRRELQLRKNINTNNHNPDIAKDPVGTGEARKGKNCAEIQAEQDEECKGCRWSEEIDLLWA